MTKQRVFPVAVVAGALVATTSPFHLASATAAGSPTEGTTVINALGARLQPVLTDQLVAANSNLEDQFQGVAVIVAW
jgi:hypothetical protein